MVDSIEIFDLYKPGSREKVNLKIRDELFEFLRNYARAVGIERVVLAKNGPILECGENKATYMTKIDGYICKICRKSEKYAFVSKSMAKSMYLLTNDELEEIESSQHLSPFGSMATYYSKENLVNYVCEKNNTTRENLQNVLNELVDIEKNNKENEKCEKKS